MNWNCDRDTEIKLDILKWIAGFRGMPSELGVRDSIQLLWSVWHHRLVGRLVEVLKSHEIPWAKKAFREQVDMLHCAVKLRVAQHSELLEAMAASYRKCADSRTPLVLLKGQTAFRLLGAERAMRWSADIDISCAEPDRLLDALRQLGFEQPEELGTQFHLATLRRADGVLVDIQPSFSVFEMDGPATPEELSPRRHGGIWEQSIGVTSHPLKYQDLLDHSIVFDIGSESIAFANPAMAVLIAAAHVFRNSLYNPPKRVALAELAEIVELTHHVDYSPLEHAELVSTYRADAAMEVVLGIIRSVNDYQSLGDRVNTSPEPYLQFLCRHDIFCTTAPWTTNEVLNMSASASVRGSADVTRMVDHLVPAEVDAPMKPAASRYELIQAGSSTGRIDRVMSYGGFVHHSQVTLDFSHTADSLIIHVSADTLCTPGHVVRFKCESCDFKWVYFRESGKGQIKADIAFDYEVSVSGYTLTTWIPYSEINQESDEFSQISLVLTFMNIGRQLDSQVEGALLVPLRISIS